MENPKYIELLVQAKGKSMYYDIMSVVKFCTPQLGLQCLLPFFALTCRLKKEPFSI